MAHRTVREVMTWPVVTVSTETTFKDLAAIMAERELSALPVLDAEGRVVGLVSQTDLLRKEEYQEDPAARPAPNSHWHRAQAAGRTAGDVMSSPAVTIPPEASVVTAARTLDRHRVGHLVVTGPDGSIAGIVSPRDLLKVYLRSDAEIREEIVTEVIAGYLGTNPARVEVTVSDGIVTLRGDVERKSMVPLAGRLARAVDGAVSVVCDLGYVIDDSRVTDDSRLATAPDLDSPQRP